MQEAMLDFFPVIKKAKRKNREKNNKYKMKANHFIKR